MIAHDDTVLRQGLFRRIEIVSLRSHVKEIHGISRYFHESEKGNIGFILHRYILLPQASL